MSDKLRALQDNLGDNEELLTLTVPEYMRDFDSEDFELLSADLMPGGAVRLRPRRVFVLRPWSPPANRYLLREFFSRLRRKLRNRTCKA